MAMSFSPVARSIDLMHVGIHTVISHMVHEEHDGDVLLAQDGGNMLCAGGNGKGQ